MTTTQSTPTYHYGEQRIAAADLRPGDMIHHWSSRGGVWTVVRVDRALITLRSDMGATRHITAASIDAKGAWLFVKAPVVRD